MRINRNYRYRESLPVEERDSYQAWKKSYDRPKSVEDRKGSVRQKNSQVYNNFMTLIDDIYQDLIDSVQNIEDLSYSDIRETLFVNRKPANFIDEDYISFISSFDDDSDTGFAFVASNFRFINNPSDLFELSPRHTHILLVIGDDLLTHFGSREFNPDLVIKEIKNEMTINRTLIPSIYKSLKYIAKNKKYYQLEDVGSSYCTVDLGCILDFDDNYDQIRDMVITTFILYVLYSGNWMYF